MAQGTVPLSRSDRASIENAACLADLTDETDIAKNDIVSIDNLLRVVLDREGSSFASHGSTVEAGICGWTVIANRRFLEKMLSDLLRETLDLAPRGSRVAIEFMDENRDLDIVFVHTGGRFPADAHRQIDMGRTDRAPSTHRHVTPLNRMGLTLSQRIAVAHGGRVQIMTPPRIGVSTPSTECLRVTLPRTRLLTAMIA